MRIVAETGSTNADVAQAAAQGADEGFVLIAEHQNTGRGRQGRIWLDEPGSALMMSWLLRPQSDQHWGLIPLLTGLAVVEAIADIGVDAGLKWPNDIMVGDKKLGGILCESQLGPDPSVVVGLGLNLFFPSGLPKQVADRSTSLDNHIAKMPARNVLARSVLAHFEAQWQKFVAPGGPEDLVSRYRTICTSLDQEQISFTRPDGSVVVGRPTQVDQGGGLWLQTAEGPQLVTAGDANHLAP